MIAVLSSAEEELVGRDGDVVAGPAGSVGAICGPENGFEGSVTCVGSGITDDPCGFGDGFGRDFNSVLNGDS